MIYPEKQIRIKGIYGIIDAKKKPDFIFEGESHPFWEMVYVKEGSVGVAADERIYSLSAGDVIFHKPMEFHRIWSTENSSPNLNIITFEADGKKIKELENMTLKLDEVSIILLERCVEIGKKAFAFNRGGVAMSIEDERLCQEYCNYLEIFLLLLVSRGSAEKLPIESSYESKLFSDIVLFLRDSIEEKLTVDEIADRFFVSPSRVKRLFSKYAGIGIINYFNNMKILEAQKLLREGLTVAETAEKLGFSNQFYFCTVFKKFCALTPSEFRRREMAEIAKKLLTNK